LANPTLKLLFSHPAHFLSLGFGSGLAPKAPGTFGTIVGVMLFYVVKDWSLQAHLSLFGCLFLLGVFCCNSTGKALGVSDHGGIVWDEIVAMILVLAFTPIHWAWWLVAFGLFRLFDIWKPYPIRQFDAKLKNGFGVMFDDLLAAIYAILSIKLIVWIMTRT
jgi:phosphatidylglycerophosphatase A